MNFNRLVRSSRLISKSILNTNNLVNNVPSFVGKTSSIRTYVNHANLLRNQKLMPMLQELMKHPNVVGKLQELSQVLQAEGFDMDNLSGNKAVLMVKLMGNANVRTKLKELKDEIDKSGIKLNIEDMTKLIK
jgi:hypothetical protein